MSGWANQQLQALLVGLEHRTESAVITLTELKSTKGEAHVWIMRGKKRSDLCTAAAHMHAHVHSPCTRPLQLFVTIKVLVEFTAFFY